MAYDPVRRSQLYLRRAGALLRNSGVLPAENHARRDLEGEARDRLFDTGYKQIERLAGYIETFTGATLESRTALDYGCGSGRLALPLAERCSHVYGVDVSHGVLEAADRNAKEMNLTNVEWLDVGRLDELSGRYDLVVSTWVFQHIPSREGEQIFISLVRGLRPGGVGAIHFTLRPGYNPVKLLSPSGWSQTYLLMNSYSLNRLGKLLADEGIFIWHARWHERKQNAYPNVTLFFRKD